MHVHTAVLHVCTPYYRKTHTLTCTRLKMYVTCGTHMSFLVHCMSVVPALVVFWYLYTTSTVSVVCLYCCQGTRYLCTHAQALPNFIHRLRSVHIPGIQFQTVLVPFPSTIGTGITDDHNFEPLFKQTVRTVLHTRTGDQTTHHNRVNPH